ncbi:MAG TPA: NUDIX hydrolase [Anaerolineales bacterium]|nr:NUDIX hydrolase [Anaerolineales bacterium]
MADRTVRFCAACGNPVEERLAFGRVRPICPRCGWIYFADPKVAAGVLVVHEDKVLLVRRAIEPMQGRWSLPAGFVDAGEDPQEAARREALEETGLEVEITGLLEVYSGREHPAGADIVLVYSARLGGGQLRAADDAAEAAFFGEEELPEIAFEATRLSLAAWRRQRKDR